jgi:hypothetical protein
MQCGGVRAVKAKAAWRHASRNRVMGYVTIRRPAIGCPEKLLDDAMVFPGLVFNLAAI